MAGECALRSEDSERLCGGWEDRMVRRRLRTGARCRRKDLLSAYCGQPDRRSCRGDSKGSRWKPMDFFLGCGQRGTTDAAAARRLDGFSKKLSAARVPLLGASRRFGRENVVGI